MHSGIELICRQENEEANHIDNCERGVFSSIIGNPLQDLHWMNGNHSVQVGWSSPFYSCRRAPRSFSTMWLPCSTRPWHLGLHGLPLAIVIWPGHSLTMDFIHKFPAIIWVENAENSKNDEYMVLEVEDHFCSGLSHQSKQDMKFGPVIHVMTNPLECAIGPMSHINEINLQRKIGYNHIAC